MRRIIIILSLLVGCSNNYSSDELIYWDKSSSLSLNNFKGELPNDDKRGAVSYVSLFYSFESNKLKVAARFVENKSWFKKSKHNEWLLNHEQKHFDIAELYARKMRKEFSKHLGKEDQNKVIKILFDSLYVEYKNLQLIYDQETNGSIDSLVQIKWNSKIEDSLQRWSGYEEIELDIEYEW